MEPMGRAYPMGLSGAVLWGILLKYGGFRGQRLGAYRFRGS